MGSIAWLGCLIRWQNADFAAEFLRHSGQRILLINHLSFMFGINPIG
jgi:hypothetical protein